MKKRVLKYRVSRRIAALKKMCAMVLAWVCKIVCKDTPVLMANTFENTNQSRFKISNAKSLAVAAAMPIVAVPIQEVQLLDYAVAHETVNEQNNLIASTDEDLYLGLIGEDPYTSDQQRQRDKYEINDSDWYSVSFERVDGTSKCHFALHDIWIKRQGYEAEKVVVLNLPEQGINGQFRVTAIKHIIPQKKPLEDAGDGYDWRPVTGLFEHQSNQVYEINFDNGEELGVTYQHPIFSVTAGDWKLAGELEIGEEVLTKSGDATVTSSVKKGGSETVYNLEVQELHNFLVGEIEVVVHNSCVVGGKKVCPPPKVKSLVSANKFSTWINQFNKRTPIKGDPNAAWYKYQKRVSGDAEFEIPVPGSNKKMWADGFDPDANALVDAKHTASNQTFDIDKYLNYEQNPGSVQPWEKGIFQSLDDEMSKYSKIVKDAGNDVAELHIKISGDKLEARSLFTYLGGKYDFPLKVIHVP